MTFWQFIGDNLGWLFLFGIFVLPVLLGGLNEILKTLRAPLRLGKGGIHVGHVETGEDGEIHLDLRAGDSPRVRVRAGKKAKTQEGLLSEGRVYLVSDASSGRSEVYDRVLKR